jgi:hypothetical protein
MPFRLSNVPAPIATESLNSWIQRVCQIYDLTFNRFYETFNIAPCIDPDLSMQKEDFTRISHISKIPGSDFKFISNSFCRIKNFPELKSLLLSQTNGLPAYRFCTKCWSNDEIPFLRLEWRFKAWKYCPIHDLPLGTTCHECHSHLAVHRSILGGSRKPSPVFNLAFCLHCRSDLRLGNTNQTLNESQKKCIREQIQFQRALISTILHGHFFIAPFKDTLPLHALTEFIERIGLDPDVMGVNILHPQITIEEIRTLLKKYQKRPSYPMKPRTISQTKKDIVEFAFRICRLQTELGDKSEIIF